MNDGFGTSVERSIFKAISHLTCVNAKKQVYHGIPTDKWVITPTWAHLSEVNVIRKINKGYTA